MLVFPNHVIIPLLLTITNRIVTWMLTKEQ